MNSADVTVVGMGNILFGDEGVGVYAAHYLRAAYRFSPQVEICDGAMLGFALTDVFQDGGRVVVLDSLLTNARPGTVYRLPSDELLNLGPETRPTAHEVDPVNLLKQATGLGIAVDLTLIGIVPGDFSAWQIGLTPQVRAAFPVFIGAIVGELRRRGIEAEPVGKVPIPLEEVIDGLVAGVR